MKNSKPHKQQFNPEIPALTGVRAIAAYMVFVHHYYGAGCNSLEFQCKIFMELHTGVSIFFVLSGFLIAYKYYQTSRLNFSWLKKYYVSRFARIYPLLFLITLVTLIIIKSSFTEWFLSLTILKGFLADYRFAVISQTWTLTVELVFYLLAPFIFILAKNKASLFLQFMLIFLSGILIATKGDIGNLQAFISSHLFLLIHTFFGRSFEFFIGIFLALLVMKNHGLTPMVSSNSRVPRVRLKPEPSSSTDLRPRFYEGIIKNPTPGVGFSGAGVLGKAKITWSGFAGIIFTIILISTFQSENFRYGIFSPQGLLIHNFILPVFITVLFLGLIYEKTILSRLLSTPLFVLLGKSSYAFYLIHLGVLANLIPAFFRFNMFTFFLTLNLLSISLFLFFEKPVNKWVKKILQ